MARVILAALTYVASLLLVAALAFVVVIFVAGPHAGLLPQWLEGVVLVAGWLAVLVLPVLTTVKVWNRLGRAKSPELTEPDIPPT